MEQEDNQIQVFTEHEDSLILVFMEHEDNQMPLCMEQEDNRMLGTACTWLEDRSRTKRMELEDKYKRACTPVEVRWQQSKDTIGRCDKILFATWKWNLFF